MTPPLINAQEFLTFVIVLVRVSTILFLAPVFGSDLVFPQLKIAIALVTSLLLTGLVKINPNVFPQDPFGFLPLMLRELIVGLVIAVFLRLVLESVQFAGQFIGYQMGFAIANVIDPQSGDQSSVVGQLMYLVALLIFLTLNGHHIVIQGLVESFKLAPPGIPTMPGEVVREIIRGAGDFFILALKIGAPPLAILFFIKVCMGIIAKTVPQLNVMFVGMPLYIIIGLSVLALSFTWYTLLLGRATAQANQVIFGILKAL